MTTPNSQTDSDKSANLLQWIGTPQANPPWSLFDAGLAVFALLLTMTVIATAIALNASGTDVAATPPRSAFILGWAVAGIITTAFVVIRWRRTTEMWQAMRIVAPRMGLPLVGLIGVAAALVIDLVVAAANGGVRPTAALSGLGDASNEWVLAAIFAIVAQPVAESLVFFGVVQARLRASIGPWAGYLATVLLFTVYHALVFGAQLTGGVMLWYGIVYPALVALFLGALRVRLGSTLAVIFAYVAMGITSVLTALVVVS